MAHGGRQRGGWTDQCSGTDPGAVQPARDGRVRHGYPYRSDPRARSHAVRLLPQDGPRGLPHHVSREAAAFEVMLTRGYSGTRAGAFIIPIPGAIARAMKRRPRCGPRPNGRARRCPCPPGPWCGVRADRRSPMRIDSGFVEPFDFAAFGARQPTSRARVLEVRIQSPPPERVCELLVPKAGACPNRSSRLPSSPGYPAGIDGLSPVRRSPAIPRSRSRI